MKTALKIAAGVGALSALSGLTSVAHAQSSATATAAGTATIIQAISVSKSTDLAFGTIVKPTSGTSTISVSSAGVRSITGNAVAANANGVSRALFAVTGEGASVFSISVPSSFSMTAGSNSLVVTTASSAASATLSGSAGAQGSATFGVGGSFPLETNTASGAYSGNFVVTVTYN
jgi:spore coat protein U-like protein